MFKPTKTRKSQFSIDMEGRLLHIKDVRSFIAKENNYSIYLIRHYKGIGYRADASPTTDSLAEVALDVLNVIVEGFLIKFADSKRKSVLSEGFFFSIDKTDLILKEERGYYEYRYRPYGLGT